MSLQYYKGLRPHKTTLCYQKSSVRTVLSWRGWATPARLSYGALLLHMPLHQSLIAARSMPTTFDRPTVIMEWFAVAVASYLAALPLALLVELPALRLYRALRDSGTSTETSTQATPEVVKADAPPS
ncbi:hypothetical protein ACJJTC_016462 [Scirpophaga incertulas]